MQTPQQGRPGRPRKGGAIKHAPQLQTFRPPENVSDLAYENAHLAHGQIIEWQFRSENLYIRPTVMPLVGKLIRREPVNTEEIKTLRYLITEAAKDEPQVNPVIFDLLGGETTLEWIANCLNKKSVPSGA